MRQIKVEKVTLNIGCGADKEKLERARKLLEMLTGKKIMTTKSKKRSTFGIVKGKPIGAMVTLRNQDAMEFLKRAIGGVENKLKSSQFADGGFSFGIKEYIDMPNTKYSHDVGMMGFDVAVTLERPGFRVKKRRVQKAKIPAKHNINKVEAMDFAKKTFGVEVSE